eukprot:TRINITY_DN9828_c0_g1_i2.p1 TRINITY_DN9828_c0_g1~~TRINITY_DN9828_c0_g1_i2.p1  ORF type:complete len:162 (+),score=25.71 TRINITY_DN9828_c0_g1_i2:226-711(+)
MQDPNGTKRITDVVFDPTGHVQALYNKHHLFATEALAGYTAGPFEPTVFQVELGGETHTVGLIICYEGAYPAITGDWTQMEHLKAAGADAFLWQIGSAIPPTLACPVYAKKFNVSVVCSEDAHPATLLAPGGSELTERVDLKVELSGYKSPSTTVAVASMP